MFFNVIFIFKLIFILPKRQQFSAVVVVAAVDAVVMIVYVDSAGHANDDTFGTRVAVDPVNFFFVFIQKCF